MGARNFEPPAKVLNSCPIQPIGWRLVIAPYEPEQKSEGGIYIAEQALEAERLLTFCGKVVAMGEACYKAVTRSGLDMSQWTRAPQVGDWVIYGTYGGQRVVTKNGARFVITNDDAVLAIVDGPHEFKYYL